MRLRPSIAILAAVALTTSRGSAQRPGTLVTVTGFAYDSLRHAPLADAFVSLIGSSRTATSDNHGYFHFDSVPPGRYTVDLLHDALDSIGLSGLSVKATVTDGRDTLRIAVPSFATLWSVVCNTKTPPADTGFIFGVVRNADQHGAGNSTVTASWLDIFYDSTKGASSKQWTLEVKTDERGAFSICGVPTTTGLRVGARTDSAASGYIDLIPGERRIWRRDLMLAPAGDSTANGIIAGVVTGENGRLLSGARVGTRGAGEVRTSPDGRFVLRNVPAGTRQIEVRAIGRNPVTIAVDVVANQMVTVTVDLSKIAVLDTLEIKATTVRQKILAAADERKKMGNGYYRDSTQVGRGTLEAAFRQIPSVTVKIARGRSATLYLPNPPNLCLATLFIDGILQTDQNELAFLDPDQIALIEVYPHAMSVPPEFTKRGSDHGVCGSVVIWTKRIVP